MDAAATVCRSLSIVRYFTFVYNIFVIIYTDNSSWTVRIEKNTVCINVLKKKKFSQNKNRCRKMRLCFFFFVVLCVGTYLSAEQFKILFFWYSSFYVVWKKYEYTDIFRTMSGPLLWMRSWEDWGEIQCLSVLND